MTWVPPEINRPEPGGVLLVLRDPGKDEVAYRQDPETGKEYPQGRPTVGLAGQEMERCLSYSGLRRQEINIANVCGGQPDDNEFSNHPPEDVERGLRELQELVERLRPRLIIAFGNEANYSLVPGWPTRGNGIFGAKGIEDRRGYFWETPVGWVLSALHPAAVLRKPVPGHYLLEHDFRRARKWLGGSLPRESLPPVRRLDQVGHARLLRSRLVAWDIETKWDMTALLCSGYCGDDLTPYVTVYPGGFDRWGRSVLTAQVPKVGHNGSGFDLPAMELFLKLKVQGYQHDTQHMWWALEPELAGQDETSGGEWEITTTYSRMTRKALAFLCTIYDFNLPWWKDYPEPDDPEHLEKMLQINTVDTWTTRQLAEGMLTEIAERKLVKQYDLSIDLIPLMVEMTLQGMLVDDPLRRKRIRQLFKRERMGEKESQEAGLRYIQEHQLQGFRDSKQCECCGGGKVSRHACWRCKGFEKKPTKKQLGDVSLADCDKCHGEGKLTSYHFNPFSGPQLRSLLYGTLNVPKSYQRKKEVLDEFALKKVLRWARG